MTFSRRRVLLLLLLWVAAIGAATMVDRTVAQWVQTHRPLDKPAPAGVIRIGNHPIWLTRIVRLPGNYGFVLVAGIGVALFHRRRWRAAIPVLLSGPMVGITYVILKWIVGRRRPVIEIAPFSFHPFINGFQGLFRSVSGLAFPSGDATMAFAAAACMAVAIPRLSIAFFAWAAAVAAERVLENAHYVSDVIAGAGLGILCAFFVIRISEKFFGESSRRGFDVDPRVATPVLERHACANGSLQG